MGKESGGFASLTKSQREKVARSGGQACQSSPHARHWTPESAKAASAKGLKTRRENALKRLRGSK